MRRKDREITQLPELIRIIEQCRVCRLAMRDGEQLYIVPLNFGYSLEDGCLSLYFHSANEGKKLELLRVNPQVGFEMDSGHQLKVARTPCQYGYRYMSIIGNGRVEFIEAAAEKVVALQAVMRQQTEKSFGFDEEMMRGITVFCLRADSFSGKISL